MYYRYEKFRTKNHCGAKYLGVQRCETASPNWHETVQGDAQLRNMKQEQDRRPRKERSINAVLFWYSTNHRLKTWLKIMMVSNRKKLQKALFNTHTTIPIADHDVAAVLDGRVPHTHCLQNPLQTTNPICIKRTKTWTTFWTTKHRVVHCTRRH